MKSDTPRRYFRYHTHTPVCIAAPGFAGMMVPGLVSKLSRSGMEVHAGVNLQPGELIEVEFRSEVGSVHVSGVVRNRSGSRFGVEFSDLQVDLGNPFARCQAVE
jgi:hypothetical protein